MIKIRLLSFIFAALLTTGIASGASAVVWETVKTEIQGTKSIVKESEIEIMTAPSTIIVNANRPVQIKVFTILGRIVSSETLQPGTSKLHIAAHGVYIVKVGELTCKVAI